MTYSVSPAATRRLRPGIASTVPPVGRTAATETGRSPTVVPTSSLPSATVTTPIVSSAARRRPANSRSACGSAGSVTSRYCSSLRSVSASASSTTSVAVSPAVARSSPVASRFGSGAVRQTWTTSPALAAVDGSARTATATAPAGSVGPSPAAREPTARYETVPSASRSRSTWPTP